MNQDWKWLRPAVWGFYFVVVLEFLFMISPFALHFYSAYGPTLNILHGSPATAWLTGTPVLRLDVEEPPPRRSSTPLPAHRFAAVIDET